MALTRSSSMAHLNSSALDMELLMFLKKVWEERASRLSQYKERLHDGVYSLYNQVKERNKFSLGTDKGCALFLNGLITIVQMRTLKASPIVQGYEDFSFADLLQCAAKLAKRMPLDLGTRLGKHIRQQAGAKVASNALGEDFLKRLFSTFFHFMGPRWSQVQERLYLNVKADSTISVMQWVVLNLVDQVPGVVEAKVAGPLGLQLRTDVIVIYMKDAQTRDHVRHLLVAYQNQGRKDYFIPQVPAMTKRVGEGIAQGAEPPPIRLTSTGPSNHRVVLPHTAQSFGGLRADLIARALQESENGFGRFLERVVSLFRQAGIDPADPALQGWVRQLTLDGMRNLADEICRMAGQSKGQA
jgi:hypothetical protein